MNQKITVIAGRWCEEKKTFEAHTCRFELDMCGFTNLRSELIKHDPTLTSKFRIFNIGTNPIDGTLYVTYET